MSIISGTLAAVHAVRRALRPSHPMPKVTKLTNLPVAGGYATAIHRTWHPGDAEACQLCRRCTARDNTCLIAVLQPRPLTRAQAAIFSTAGLTFDYEVKARTAKPAPIGYF